MAIWRRATPKTVSLSNMDSLALAGSMLETQLGLVCSGIGSICYRGVGGRTFRNVENNAYNLLTHCGMISKAAEIRADDYGFKWLIVHRAHALYPSLVADLRAASRIFVENSYGAQLLCAMTIFEGHTEAQAALVYLYKRDSLYPFAPQDGENRDNRLESKIKDTINEWVPLEPDLTRWFPIWNAPGFRH
jgi:hypothetical protein